MDAFDFKDEPRGPKLNLKSSSNLIWGLGTAYFLLSTVCLVVFFALTFINPYNSFNPLPPATPFPTSDQPVPTETPTQEFVPPTATLEIPPEVPVDTEVPAIPTEGTPAATIDFPSQTPVITSAAPSTTPAAGGPHYSVSGEPTFTTHIDGCGGAYVAGNVTDINGNPLVFMIIRIGGTMDGESINEDTLSGSAAQYSESGWEFKISDALVKTTGTLFVQLFSLESEEAVSDLIIIDTSDICDENVTLVNFVQDQ